MAPFEVRMLFKIALPIRHISRLNFWAELWSRKQLQKTYVMMIIVFFHELLVGAASSRPFNATSERKSQTSSSFVEWDKQRNTQTPITLHQKGNWRVITVALCRLVGVIRSFACFQGFTVRFVFTKSFLGFPDRYRISANSFRCWIVSSLE